MGLHVGPEGGEPGRSSWGAESRLQVPGSWPPRTAGSKSDSLTCRQPFLLREGTVFPGGEAALCQPLF